MTFVAVIAVFVLVQFWGSAEAFHHDGWFRKWLKLTRTWFSGAGLQVIAQVFLPVLALWLILTLLKTSWVSLYFLVSIPLLLYSLGRGNYTEWLEGYCEAYHRNDNEVACDYAARLGVDVEACEDWPTLHEQVLQRAGYLGFERWFAAIFWFVILGAVGAVLYRLASLARNAQGQSDEVKSLCARLCWLLEWPVVRLLGLSFALAGNFVGCIGRWKDCLLAVDMSTEQVMETCVHGSLNVNSREITSEGITEQEVEALIPLLSRSLILWLCVLAVFSIL
ncbi:regulatory signaling modulator protein AmpE [Pseudomaricurvus sp.]|uniref:regulatory signaling modulator protein AmpE n=1 Tax=Pseudomaricurvus sp. TaxID=2004510 RepID=UPI003F6A824E